MLTSLVFAATMAALPAGEWVPLFADAGAVLYLPSDSEGSIYFPPGKVRYADGRWDSLPSLNGSAGYLSIANSRDYWVSGEKADTGLFRPENAQGMLTHYRDGKSVVYDTANSCLDGNRFRLLGFDAGGRLLVDQRYYRGLGGPSTGVIRFNGKDCEPIGLGLQGEMGAIAYARDSAGTEYFSTRAISDAPACGDLLRWKDGSLDVLLSGVCINKLLARGSDVWAASDIGVWVFSGGEAKRISEIQGRHFPPVTDLLFDSRGVLWIATEGYASYPENIGVAAISGADTVIYNKENSDFPDLFATGLAEDAQGNVWVATMYHGVAVFARDKSVLSLGRPASGRQHRPPAIGFRYDLLGRLLRPRPDAPRFRADSPARPR
jgi:hypothetical protein